MLASELLAFRLANCVPHVGKLHPLRIWLLKKSGIHIGSGPHILGPISMRDGAYRNLKVGNNVFINMHVWFGCEDAEITVGDEVLIGPRVTIVTATHDLSYTPGKLRSYGAKPVTISRGAWIGANATILPGITIGEGAVVAAGAVVSKSVDALTVVAGVPAREIKKVPLG